MFVCAFCGVFGECVAIASVGVVKNHPVLDTVGGYGSQKLSFHLKCREQNTIKIEMFGLGVFSHGLMVWPLKICVSMFINFVFQTLQNWIFKNFVCSG